MSKVPHTCCDECGGVIVHAHRLEAGKAYCGRCYARVFVSKPCVKCGKSARVHRYREAPLCRTCVRAGEVCLRCAKAIVGKAGRRIQGKPVCPSCAPHFRELRRCPECGRESKRLSRIPSRGIDIPVCDRCRGAVLAGECSICGKICQPVGGQGAERTVCRSCAFPDLHGCDQCGAPMPGAKSGICRACSHDAKVERRVRADVQLLEQTWVRDLFLRFCSWDGFSRKFQRVLRRIDVYAEFFRRIDTNCRDPSRLTQDRLFEMFGAEGLRRCFQALSFLVAEAGLVWDPSKQKDLVETRRVATLLATHEGRAWINDLRNYYAALRARTDRPLKLRTIRGYVIAAAGLLHVAHVDAASTLEETHIRRYLARHRGQAASITPFLAYLEETYGTAISRPAVRKSPVSVRDRHLVARARMLLRSLDSSTGTRQRRAIVATLIADLNGVPLEHVLALRGTDAVRSGGAVSLWRGKGRVELAGAVANAFREIHEAERSDYVFPGRMRGQPMTVESVRYQILKVLSEGTIRGHVRTSRKQNPASE